MAEIPTTQNALVLNSPHTNYELTTRPVPRPGPNEVLVRIYAVGLNPADWKLRKYDMAAMFGVSYPAVLGTDGAGVVVDIGAEVVDVKIGDKVAVQGSSSDRGTMQEYALAAGNLVMPVPSSMAFTDAVTLPSQLTAAAFGMCCSDTKGSVNGGMALKPFWEDGAKDAYKDTPFLVIGGSSSVGQYVIQLAKYQGFSPVITTASMKHAAFLETLGADSVLDRHANIAEEIQRKHPGLDLPYIYDAVHDPLTQAEVDLLGPDGIILTTNPLPKNLTVKDGQTLAFVWGLVHAYPGLGHGMYSRIPYFLEEGFIKPSRIEVVEGGLGGINGALERLEKGQISGHKLVVPLR